MIKYFGFNIYKLTFHQNLPTRRWNDTWWCLWL